MTRGWMLIIPEPLGQSIAYARMSQIESRTGAGRPDPKVCHCAPQGGRNR